MLFRLISGVRAFRYKDAYSYKLLRTFSLFLLVFALHVWAMMLFEGMGIGDAAWLTITSASTTGYGDLSASTGWGRLSTTILIYGVAIVALAKLGADYLEHMSDKKEKVKMGLYSYESLKNHVVILNSPNINPERFFSLIKEQIEHTASLKDKKVVIVSNKFDALPKALEGWSFVRGDHFKKDSISRSGVRGASHIFVLSDTDMASDGETMQALSHIKRLNKHAYVVAEYVDIENKGILKSIRADSVLRQIRSYPEIFIRTADEPGSEMVLETLFDGKKESISIDIYTLKKHNTWQELSSQYLETGLGTLIGYERDGVQNLSPKYDEIIKSGDRLMYISPVEVVE